MKIILSRKAFDSGAGRVANPILDDGTMLPLPIPDKTSPIRYEDINLAGHNLGHVASDLTGGRTRADHFAHLDPDLDEPALKREPGWRPLLGQAGAAQSVLGREQVGPGDLFLFFGWFRRASNAGGRYRYVPREPNLHVLWGWLQVGDVVPVESGPLPGWMSYHPHLASGRPLVADHLYVARRNLVLDGIELDLPGAGRFPKFKSQLQLTAPGFGRSNWRLPAWFAPSSDRPPLGYHARSDRWQVHDDHVLLKTVGRGQEFVLDADAYPEAQEWATRLIC